MISAVVLAAGMSRRMGRPKMCLPWGDSTVIGSVVHALLQAGLTNILVVTGGGGEAVQTALRGLPVQQIHNPGYQEGEMLRSLQVGLRALPEACQAALVALGDQPHIQPEVVSAILALYEREQPALVVPSFQMRRGHPWLIARSLWPRVLALGLDDTPRDFLNASTEQIAYLKVDTDSILRDLDTPEDYLRERLSKTEP